MHHAANDFRYDSVIPSGYVVSSLNFGASEIQSRRFNMQIVLFITRCLIVAALSAALLGGCGSSNKTTSSSSSSSSRHDDSLTVSLMFTPERASVGEFPPVERSPGLRLYIPPTVDERSITDRIGENLERVEQMGIRPIRATGTEPAALVHSVITRSLPDIGYRIVNDRAQANRVLKTTLIRFWTTESSTYQGEVRVAAEVLDENGEVLWSGQGVGTRTLWGRSFNERNYNRVYSDSSLRTVRDLLENEDFRAAITVR
jgi:hypothetical protein